MKKYPKFKNSRVPWIGNMPSEWQVSKFKFVTEVVTGNTPSTANEENYTEDENGYIWVKPSVLNEYIPVCNSAQRLTEIGKSNVRIIPKGSVMICCIGNTLGRFGITGKEMCTNQQINSLVPDNVKIMSGYLKFYAGHISSELIEFSNFATLPMLTKSGLEDVHTILPPLPEQKAIATYLDEKTTLIDALIEKTEKKIELLKEQRTAIINQAVTKGLDTKAKMKDSGVEWIGEIPEGWEYTRLKYVTNQVVDGSHFTPTYTDSGVPFLRVTDLVNKEIDFSKIKFISSEEHATFIKRCNPEKGDLLLSKNGTIGRTKIVDWDWEFSIFVSICLIKFRKNYNAKLFSYLFQSDVIDEQIKASSKQSTVTNLHLDKIRELVIVNPPIEVQNSIVKYLDKEIQKFDMLLSSVIKRVELLKEYRQALISEVVTGKICVLDEIPTA